MITNEKLEIIYQIIMGNVKLSKYNLNLRRISDEEIEELIDMNIIKVIGEDMYQLVYARGLYKYGIKLLNDKQGKYANMCFKKSYEIDSSEREICIQYMIELIKKNEYDKAFDVYQKMIVNSTEEDKKEDNLYLCLFGRLMSFDLEVASKIKDLCYKDILLEDNKDNEIDNEIRKNIMQSKYTYAYSLVNTKIRKDKGYNVLDMFVKSMLNVIMDKEKKDKYEMLNYAKEEKYDLIISMLEDMKKQKILNRIENSIMILCEVILKVNEGNLLELNEFNEYNDINNVYDAIIVKDYKLALEINMNYLKYRDTKCEDDVLYILLSKVNSLVDEVKSLSLSSLEDTVVYNEVLVDNEIESEKDIDSLVKIAEEWAYYFKSLPIGIDTSIKRNGLFTKYALLVKLVLARDFYLASDYLNGDVYLSSVENRILLDKDVEMYLEEVKNIRNSNYISKDKVRKLVK